MRASNPLKKKIKVTIYLQPESYYKLLHYSKVYEIPLSRLISNFIEEFKSLLLGKVEVGGSSPPWGSFLTKIKNEFWLYLKEKNLSEKTIKHYQTSFGKTPLHLFNYGVKTYLYKSIIDGKVKKTREIKVMRHFVRFLYEKKIITQEELSLYLSKLKIKKDWKEDNKVPTDEEIRDILMHLKGKWLISYLILLTSGIRVTELDLIPKNLDKVDVFESFARIGVLANRKTKRVEYVYIPIWLWFNIKENTFARSEALKSYLKRRVLLPAKYTRKWFYTKALDLGIPVEIADFYQGRIPQRIGLRHYYNALHRADELYGKVLVPYFREFLEGIAKDKKEVDELLRQKPLKG